MKTTKINNHNNVDIIIENITVSAHGNILLENTDLKIIDGHKYGLIGHNGVGKTTLLKYINDDKINISPYIDRFYVDQDLQYNRDENITDIILNSNIVRKNLLEKSEHLKNIIDNDDNYSSDILDEYNIVQEELVNIGADRDKSIVMKILYGLGFELEDQKKKISEFSGGWRMRISLAKALYMKPKLLLLDEPNNHLDLNANIWLTDYLTNHWKNTIIIVSHDTYFLDEICTDIINLENKKLTYFKGNYRKFVKGYELFMRTRDKEWEKIIKRVKEMRRKNTPKKLIDDLLKKNDNLKPPKPYIVKLDFFNITDIESPLLVVDNISFGYNDKILFNNVNLRVDFGDRYTIVGKNGVGKSTLFKLIMEQYNVTSGIIHFNRGAKIGYYHQHATDILPLDMTSIEYIRSIDSNISIQEAHKYLGTIGLPGNVHKICISNLSGGQKSRLLFVVLQIMKPHIILLDEPTNHLDIETINALCDSINEFSGAIITITHNIDFIENTKSKILELSDGNLVETTLDEYYDKIIDSVENII